MTTETVLTGQQALEALIPLGFSIEKTTDRVYIKRGALKLTLPKEDGLLNSYLNDTVNGIIKELSQKAERLGTIKRKDGTPMMVTYRSVVYAVVEDRHTKWQLQDLDEGRRFEALKEFCREYTPEPLTFNGFEPEEAQPAPAPEPVLTPMTNPSDLAAMHRQVRRYVERLKVEYEQVENKAAHIRSQMQPAMDFLRSLGEDLGMLEVAAIPPLEEKRTILPPSDAPRKRGGPTAKTSEETIRQLKDAWIAIGRPTNYGYIGKVKEEMRRRGQEVPVADNTLYGIFKQFKKEM